MDNATTFGLQADVYSSARPTYPEELLSWIADQAPRRNIAWDVGTGSGQAALMLADYFSKVHATDIDKEQIRRAPAHHNVDFAIAPAHISGLSKNSVDAITVATALHWFDHARFWQEVKRVARPDAIFCAWTYHRAETDEQIQNSLINPVAEVVEPYWSDGNRLSWRGYSKEELQMPFEVVAIPHFQCNLQWTPLQIAGFIRSWSAYQKACLNGHEEALATIEAAGLAKLEDNLWDFVLPLNLLAARIP
ncbi:MAG: class I SAM-dependent methyltransferase [Pseudomonadota bacterium]